MSEYKSGDDSDKKHIIRMAFSLVQTASALRKHADFPSAEDNVLALRMYERAGELGYAAGMASAASMYSSGAYGIEQDPVKAEALYKQAIELSGGVTSYSAAGWLYEMQALEAHNAKVLLELNTGKNELPSMASHAFTQQDGRVQRGESGNEQMHHEYQGLTNEAFDSIAAKAEHFERELPSAASHALAAFEGSAGLKAIGDGLQGSPDASGGRKPTEPRMG